MMTRRALKDIGRGVGNSKVLGTFGSCQGGFKYTILLFPEYPCSFLSDYHNESWLLELLQSVWKAG